MSLTFVPAPYTRLLTRRPPRLRRSICTAALPSVTEIAQSVRSSETSATELLEKSLSQVKNIDPHINAFLTVDVQRAFDRAKEIDKLVANGKDPGPLAGVPVAVKDNICTKGIATTAGSAILDGFVPAYDATVVKKMLDAGAVILGKANLDEFGMGSSTENSVYGPTLNPWDTTKVPGGSSGGSAAAVAAGMCPVALGSDTGGSIRIPASFCGVTGLKPSYGRVSRHGLLAYASSLDTIGPIGRSVEDCATMLQVLAGADGMDGTAVDQHVPNYLEALTERSLSGITVGVVQEAMTEGVDGDVRKAVQAAVDQLKSLGATVRDVSLPRQAASMAAYYVLAPSEASANLARYDGVRYGVRDLSAENSADMYARSRARGFGAEVKRRIMVGTYALSSGYYDAYYLRAQRVRSLMAEDFRRVFESGVDVLVSPVAPSAAFGIGEKVDDQVSMYLVDLMTIPASLAGLPGLSVPCGQTASRLPIGMQIVGPFLGEEMIMKIGHAFQQATEHHLHVADVLERHAPAAV